MVRTSMLDFLGSRVKVATNDQKELHGVLLAFDGQMNLILDECERSRFTKKGKIEREHLGLVMIRGSTVVSVMSADVRTEITQGPGRTGTALLLAESIAAKDGETILRSTAAGSSGEGLDRPLAGS